MDQYQNYFHLAKPEDFEDYYNFKNFVCQNIVCSKTYTLSNFKFGATEKHCCLECSYECIFDKEKYCNNSKCRKYCKLVKMIHGNYCCYRCAIIFYN